MARSTPTSDPDVVVLRTRRDTAFIDAISGTETTLAGATALRCLLQFLDEQCDGSPVHENRYRSLEDHIQAAVVVAWDALCSVEVGAKQARTLLQELQAQEGTR